MPEGDTIHRIVANLRRVLVGEKVLRFEAPRLVGAAVAPGTLVQGVEAVGKHCLVRFGDGQVLRTHLGMKGSWHLYRPGERWQRSPGGARVIIETPAWTAVCFTAPTVELTRPPTRSSPRAASQAPTGEGEAGAVGLPAPDPAPDGAFAPSSGTAHLGPDLCRSDADLDEVMARLDTVAAADWPLTEALLDQRIAAGIGNVYASEACWACRLHPAMPVGALPPGDRRRLFATAAEQLRANLTTTRRTTIPGGLAVYGRAGRPCPRCGTTVQRDRLGRHHRSAWWCPSCQRLPGAASS